MKKDIHPVYHKDAKIICACGQVFEVGSTVKEVKVELCSNCHPFYTGKQRFVDTQGRVDRFKKMTEKVAEVKEVVSAHKSKTEKKAIKVAKKGASAISATKTKAPVRIKPKKTKVKKSPPKKKTASEGKKAKKKK